ncbi:MAG: hypothetical protein B6D59_05540 [Campylobacteraceae bacterium 4484_4]|nr:MAG: hypothetical protein B6D59_05540 [Campylobacteraceae bacterium 4484_4]
MRIEVFDTTKHYKGLKSFDCGNEMINRFVQKSLKKRISKHLSQAYVLLHGDRFAGFYTLDTFAIRREEFDPQKRPSGLPPIVPVVKIGMLGLSVHLQGKGIEKRLLRDTFTKIIVISKLAGCAGVFLLAEKEAVTFYESLGFITLKETTPRPMFLPIETLTDPG